MTKEKLVEALKSLIRGGGEFRKLSVQVVGNGDTAATDGGKEDGEADCDDETDHEMAKYAVQIRGAQEGEDGSKFVMDLAKFKDSLEVYPVWHIVE